MNENDSLILKKDMKFSDNHQIVLIPQGTEFIVRSYNKNDTLFQDAYSNNYHLIHNKDLTSLFDIKSSI